MGVSPLPLRDHWLMPVNSGRARRRKSMNSTRVARITRPRLMAAVMKAAVSKVLSRSLENMPPMAETMASNWAPTSPATRLVTWASCRGSEASSSTVSAGAEAATSPAMPRSWSISSWRVCSFSSRSARVA